MKITVETTIQASLEEVWRAWVTAEDIMQWNAASEDWHTTSAEIDLRVGGRFSYRMEAKDGSMGFDFVGQFTQLVKHESIEYTMEDGRQVFVHFEADGELVSVREVFEAETQNSIEMQRQGWQAILDNFGKHVEAREER